MADRRPLLRDVAREAGVSLKTASRVLNGDGTVSPERAERVRRAIAALGYVPSAVARQLRMGGEDGIATRDELVAAVMEYLTGYEDRAAHVTDELFAIVNRNRAQAREAVTAAAVRGAALTGEEARDGQ